MSYQTILKSASAELTEQRSRFIAAIFPVSSEEEANELINARKQQFWDAKHNVYAYRLVEGNIARFSDDGEPHSTAGKPTLEALTGAGLTNCLIITTRYFGGVLLGTGGLVRAYSSAARLAIEASEIVTVQDCDKFKLRLNYSQYDKFLVFLKKRDINIISSDFSEQITLEVILPSEDAEDFIFSVRDAFFGEIIPEFIENCRYAL